MIGTKKLGEYPYTYVRSNVMKSLLLKKEDYHKLLKMSLPEITRYLQESEYKREIDELAGRFKGIDLIELAINKNLVNCFNKLKRISNITQAFRIQYYELVKRILLKKRQVLPCYAGFISAQIAPDGEVWPCCINAESIGNLRDVNYDFRKVWFSKKAQEKRKSIREKKCYCPLANASYTNMLFSFRTLAKVLKYIVIQKVKSYS